MLTSVLVAGVVGAVLLTVAVAILASQGTNVPTYTTTMPVGFAVGAGVQISVRLLGVS